MKGIFPVLIFLHFCGHPAAQSTTSHYFGPNNKPLENKSGARTRLDIVQNDSFSFEIHSYRKKDQVWSGISIDKVRIKSADNYIIRRYVSKVLQERITRTFESVGNSMYSFTDKYMGKVIREGSSSSKFPLILQNDVREYYKNGKLKSESLFRDNQLISNENLKPNGEQYLGNIFYSVDNGPTYPGGEAVLHNHLYQHIMKKSHMIAGHAGTVLVRFVVMENGETAGVYVESGIEPEVNSLVAEAVGSLPGKWKPGVLNGKKVRCSLNIPVNFLQAHEGHLFDFLEYKDGMLFW